MLFYADPDLKDLNEHVAEQTGTLVDAITATVLMLSGNGGH